MINGPHKAINNIFWQYLEISFRLYLVITLKITVRFTLKELRWGLLSFCNIISNSEERDILFFANSSYVWSEKEEWE